MKFLTRKESGFTVIELVVVIVILCILGTLVALTYSGIQANNRDNHRQADADTIQSQLEVYYALHDRYPSAGEINSPEWRATNMKNLKDDTLKDPSWDTTGACSKDNKPTLAQGAQAKCYSYEVSASDGAACDNAGIPCAHYTLTATLENGDTYVKASLN